MADRILIVDDEPEIADLISLYLQNENFVVFFVSDEKPVVEEPPVEETKSKAKTASK